MIFPNLTAAERATLENMATHGPSRTASAPIRGRLALYKLIDEVPEGWAITALGRQALLAETAVAESVPLHKKGPERPVDNSRHYGKKSRDTSWFG